jgi:hypothetical protein
MLPARLSCRQQVVALLLACCGPAAASSIADDPAAYLEFESVPDGRCQILSEGGKLRVLHNRHAKLTIDYRLMRMFPPTRQQGLVAGSITAGAGPAKLGCTRVDGREQDWVLERARYASGE